MEHFKEILAPNCSPQEPMDPSRVQVTGEDQASQAIDLSRPVQREEIEKAIRMSSPHKSPRLDGFDPRFFEVCWPIIGSDVSDAIEDFFRSGKLLKQVTNNFITLIPKVEVPKTSADFKPISLANEVYKIIIRLNVERIKPLMRKLITTVSGKSISNNVLPSHDLIRGFHLKKGQPKKCLKVDVSNAFDSVS